MAINDLYRFWLDLPGKGITQVLPFNSQLKWVDKHKTGYRFYQRTLETALILKDVPLDNIYDFTGLMDMERQGMTCTKVPISIDAYCDCDETWHEGFYTGYLKLNAGEWNVSECTVTIPIVVQDKFTCLTESWSNEINLYDYGDDPVQASPFVGVIQRKECFCDINVIIPNLPGLTNADFLVSYLIIQGFNHLCSECLTENATWAKIEHCGYTSWPLFGTNANYPIHLKTSYAREFVAGASIPDGIGWIAVSGGYARPVPISDGAYLSNSTVSAGGPWAIAMSTENFTNPTPDFLQYLYIGFHKTWNIIGVDINGNSTFANGKEIGPVLDDMLAPCGITVVSNFLNINPDGTNPDNDYYTRAPEDFHGLLLYQISDIARIDETQSATIALVKLKEILDAVKVYGNLDIDIDGTVLRIEHLSYWPNTVAMDLTTDEFLYLIKSKWKYTYDQESQPKTETIAHGVETDGRGNDFDGYPIEYDNACVNDTDKSGDKTYQATNFVTNLEKIVGNEDYFDDTQTIVLVATKKISGKNVIQSALQPISGAIKLNGNLALGYLLPRYYDYGRPFKEGNINKNLTPFFTLLRNRLQAPITIPMDCNDYMNNYDPSGLIKTQLGACEIDTATYTVPDKQMEFKLRAK